MRNIILLILLFIGSLEICAQSLDSVLIYKDASSECPKNKRAFTYNDQGQNILTTYGEIVSNGSGCEFIISEKDSLVYDDFNQLIEIYHFAETDGIISIRTRSLYYYDEHGNDTIRLIEPWNPFINNWSKWIRVVNTYSNGNLVESTSYAWLEYTEEWTNLFRTERNFDPVSNRLVDQIIFVSDFLTTEETTDSRNDYYFNNLGYLEEDLYSDYKDSTSSFLLRRIKKYGTDNFGNILQLTTFTVDSNDVQTLSSRAINTFNTDIEKDQVDIPSYFHSDTSRHILLQGMQDDWVNDEWVFREKKEYYYSELTKTDDPLSYKKLKIFPNPATATIHFSNPELLERNISVRLIKSDGTFILNKNVNQGKMNIDQLPAGLYYVILRNNDTHFKGSFIKI